MGPIKKWLESDSRNQLLQAVDEDDCEPLHSFQFRALQAKKKKKTWCGKCGSGATSHWLDMNWQPQRREDKMVLAFGSAIFTNKKDPENTWKYKFRLFFGMMHGLCTCNKKLNKAAIQI